MATPAVTQEVTVNNTMAEIDAAIAAAKQTPVETPAAAPVEAPAPTPAGPVTLNKQDDGSYYVKLETGEEFKGSLEEITVKLGEAKVNTKKWADEQVKKATAPAQVETATPTTEEDPAEVFVANAVARRLGFKDESEMREFVGSSRQDAQAAREQAIAREFHRLTPDFPATPEAGEAVLKYAQENGIALTPKGLKAAHLACVNEGIYKPLTTAEISAKGPQNLRPAPAVAPSGTGDSVTEETPNVNWSWEKIRAYEQRLKGTR